MRVEKLTGKIIVTQQKDSYYSSKFLKINFDYKDFFTISSSDRFGNLFRSPVRKRAFVNSFRSKHFLSFFSGVNFLMIFIYSLWLSLIDFIKLFYHRNNLFCRLYRQAVYIPGWCCIKSYLACYNRCPDKCCISLLLCKYYKADVFHKI